MADRNELVQEKANLTGQLKEIIDDYNIKATELLKDLNATTDASLSPLNKQIRDLELKILKSIDEEAGIGGEACPA